MCRFLPVQARGPNRPHAQQSRYSLLVPEEVAVREVAPILTSPAAPEEEVALMRQTNSAHLISVRRKRSLSAREALLVRQQR